MTKQRKVLQLLQAKRGVIMVSESGQEAYAIVPRGDKRCRPVGWLNGDTLSQLLARGCVFKKGENYVLDPGYQRRTVAAQGHGAKEAFANQHRQLETRSIYHPDGIKRPTRINTHLSALTRLVNKTDKDGHSFLTPDEKVAAERFASDYARSMMAAVPTQNFASTAGRERRAVNTAEFLSISSLDARSHVMDALKAVGPGLDKVLTALCGSDMSMGQLEVSENWARGSGKTVLKLALMRLSAYYGCRPGVRAQRSS